MSSIRRISRVVADLARAEAFYGGALGFRAVRRGPVDAAVFGVGPGTEAVMLLGGQEIALVCFDAPGLAYPEGSRAEDLWFQHLAIVVSDMDAAYAHLAARPWWRPISEGGPVLLPPANGGVRAFKFRDPDGHPLELIWFPGGWRGQSGAVFLGIDHSALAVTSTGRSVYFYRRLGLRVSARSINRGPAQARLDGLPGARVRIVGLRPDDPDSAGLELLGYRPPGRVFAPHATNDTVTDWVTLSTHRAAGPLPRAVRDPDGHLLLLTAEPPPPSHR
jgi:catechol 2,3-dioxygenase-like lactoylglutathione lyase family enzyme